MKKYYSYLLLSIILFSCGGNNDHNTPATDNYNRSLLLKNVTENIIIPTHENLKAKIILLDNAVDNFTNLKDIITLKQLRQIWKETYIAWQYVEMFNIGRAEEIDYIKSMNTYPCNTTQINININSSQYNLDDANYLSWASQGLPALDYMLYGLDNDSNKVIEYYTNTNGSLYLNYLNDLVDKMMNTTDGVYNYWNNNSNSFINSTGNSITSSLNMLTNDFIYYYEKGLRANKIGLPCGRWDNYQIRDNIVEAYYRKDISKILAIESLRACKNFFTGQAFIDGTIQTGLLQDSYVTYLNQVTGENTLSDDIVSKFNNAEDKINDLNNNFVYQLNTNNNLMVEAYDALQEAVVLLKTDMLAHLSITVDYKDSDGD